jgi:hypothetical protein
LDMVWVTFEHRITEGCPVFCAHDRVHSFEVLCRMCLLRRFASSSSDTFSWIRRPVFLPRPAYTL